MKNTILFLLFLITSFASFAHTDSLDIKIGQMLMVGLPGTSVKPGAPILTDIRKGIIGGVLLYEFNLSPVNTRVKLQQFTNALHDAAKIPLFVSIDQEGGQVNRLKTKYGFPPMPSAKVVGLKHNDEYTSSVGSTIAGVLQECGINLNYAPVLDVDNPLCPVLGKRQRCYSHHPDSIAHMAGLIIDAHREKGIYTVVKHFPGHGNSRSDSHLGLADVTRYWKKEELKPYQLLLNNNQVDAVMTAHIVNRQLDSSGLPATLSYRIITGLLRNTMGFRGVVISDDMQMHAISSFFSFEESIKRSILAGVDILMFSNNIKNTRNYSNARIHAAIKKMVLNGEISMERINESYRRIMAMKTRR